VTTEADGSSLNAQFFDEEGAHPSGSDKMMMKAYQKI
jgi:hypothetical protein